MLDLNGLSIHRTGTTIFVPLPREAWKPTTGGCRCEACKALGMPVDAQAFWDTLAIAVKPDGRLDTTWMVHYPELHHPELKAKVR